MWCLGGAGLKCLATAGECSTRRQMLVVADVTVRPALKTLHSICLVCQQRLIACGTASIQVSPTSVQLPTLPPGPASTVPRRCRRLRAPHGALPVGHLRRRNNSVLLPAPPAAPRLPPLHAHGAGGLPAAHAVLCRVAVCAHALAGEARAAHRVGCECSRGTGWAAMCNFLFCTCLEVCAAPRVFCLLPDVHPSHMPGPHLYWRLAPFCLQVLPIEVLHGFTFALAWGAGCAYCQQLAPPGLEATSQGLFQGACAQPALRAHAFSATQPCPLQRPASYIPPPIQHVSNPAPRRLHNRAGPAGPWPAGLYFGLGVAAGSALGGQVYQRLGAQAVYLVACSVLAAGWLLCSLAQLALHLLAQRQGRGGGGSKAYVQVELAEPPDEEEARKSRIDLAD